MSEFNIELSQFEPSDLGAVRSLLSSDFRNFININCEMSIKNTELWLDNLNNLNSYAFAIRAVQDHQYKKVFLGVAAITNIDWISRHGEIVFFMLDQKAYSATLQNYPASKEAFFKILSYGFGQLNLNKLWIEIYDGNKITSILETYGFVAEGVRKSARYKNNKFIDATICSILKNEFQLGAI